MNGEENMIAVFIVAASPIARTGLEALLQRDERFIIADSAADVSAAPFDFSAERVSVDVILANIEREKDFNDLLDVLGDAPDEIDFPAVAVLLPAELQSSEYFLKALRNGVRGALPHHASGNEIAAVVQAAANGLISFAPEFAEGFLSSSAAEENALSGAAIGNREPSFEVEMVENLTPRETKILEMLSDGASNKSIAYQLNISDHTVKFHVASIFGKLGVNTRTEAVTIALKRGLILL